GFVEKPNIVAAEQYIISGNYYWNSGMFAFRASQYLKELTAYRPDIVDAAMLAAQSAHRDLTFIRIDEEKFTACPAESIDYAVMEHSSNTAMVPLNAGWDDLGSWSAASFFEDEDNQGNSLRGD